MVFYVKVVLFQDSFGTVVNHTFSGVFHPKVGEMMEQIDVFKWVGEKPPSICTRSIC